MSADPFRDIVKQNAHLYRDSEDARVKNTERKCIEYIEWKKLNDVYQNAKKSLEYTEQLYEKEHRIYRSTKLQ
jgi:hypothetical protein